MKTTEQEEALRLRREHGLPVPEIAARLGVSRSGASRWLRNVTLTPEQHQRLQGADAMHERQARAAAIHRATALQRRAWWQVEGRAAASRGDPLHAAASMLFWAEGSRSPNRVAVTNSDPELIRLFVRFLRGWFAVAPEELRVACNLHVDTEHEQRRLETFWLEVAGGPQGSLTRSTVNRTSRAGLGKRRNKLPFGTCRVTVHSTRIAQHLLGAIQEYGGFERPERLEAG
jgi:hypothetical protein